MTRTKKIIIGAAAVVAVISVGTAVSHSIAHERGGWGMKHAGYAMGHHGGKRMGMRVQKMFDEIDADKDGKITADELTKYRTNRLNQVDANGDGNLQLDEFQVIWAGVMRPRMVDHFQFLDEDGDGQVSEAEITTPLSMVTRRLDRNDDGVIARGELKRKHHGWHRDDDDDDDHRDN